MCGFWVNLWWLGTSILTKHVIYIYIFIIHVNSQTSISQCIWNWLWFHTNGSFHPCSGHQWWPCQATQRLDAGGCRAALSYNEGWNRPSVRCTLFLSLSIYTQMLHEWNIYLHLGHFCVNVHKYSIHGASGIDRQIDRYIYIFIFNMGVSIHGGSPHNWFINVYNLERKFWWHG